ncbi:hypothetical protein ACSBR2_040856 [Camellia fascicularis]
MIPNFSRNEIRGESLDLLKYIDNYFERLALYPDDPTKREFAEKLLSYTNTFNLAVITSLKGGSENEISTVFDYLESGLLKFTDGPFFLGRPMLTSWIEVDYILGDNPRATSYMLGQLGSEGLQISVLPNLVSLKMGVGSSMWGP